MEINHGGKAVLGEGLLIIASRPTREKPRTQNIKASTLDRSFSKPALEKRLGPYHAPTKRLQRPKPTHTYQRKPITNHKGQDRLWRRYIGMHQKRTSLVKAAFHTWKQFLMYEALNDPLAMAIIHCRNKVMAEVLGLAGPIAARRSPPSGDKSMAIKRPKARFKGDREMER